MDFTDRNARMLTLRADLERITAEFTEVRKTTEQDIKAAFKKAWEERFPQHPCYALPAIGEADDARVYLYTVQKVSFLEGGGWGIQDDQDEYGYGIPTEGPFPFSDLSKFIQDFGQENPGLIIDLESLKQRTDVLEVNSYRAIERLHPDKVVQLVEEGQVWYTGWDISDKYIIVTIDNVKHAWWSTDAHGGPLLKTAREGTPAFDQFEKWRTDPH